MLDELRTIKSGNEQLKEFGVTMAAVLVVIGDIALLRGRPFAPYLIIAAFVFLVLGLTRPRVLVPLQKAWMALGIIIGFFVSRVVLLLIYFGVLVPIGLLMRITGKDILDERIEKTKASYWHMRPVEPRPKKSYENQY